jgi:hypothetical protein
MSFLLEILLASCFEITRFVVGLFGFDLDRPSSRTAGKEDVRGWQVVLVSAACFGFPALAIAAAAWLVLR